MIRRIIILSLLGAAACIAQCPQGFTSSGGACVASGSGGGLGPVVLTGTPSSGQVPTATSSTTATWQPGGGSSATVLTWKALSQNTAGGSNFDLVPAAGTLGTPAICSTPDAGNANLDGACAFAASATNFVEGHFYACSLAICGTAFVDGIKATITNFNTSATSGTATFGIAFQCVATNAVASATGYGSTSAWNAITVPGTASQRTETNTQTITTGCSADQDVYWYISLVNGIANAVNVKRFAISGTGIAQ